MANQLRLFRNQKGGLSLLDNAFIYHKLKHINASGENVWRCKENTEFNAKHNF